MLFYVSRYGFGSSGIAQRGAKLDGIGEAIQIYLLLEQPEGYGFVEHWLL